MVKKKNYNFLLIMHEHLFAFQKISAPPLRLRRTVYL